MTTYRRIAVGSDKVQVDSAIRDGNGAKIDTTYAKKTETLPTGGTTGQVLTKKSNTDRDVEWSTPVGAVSSVNSKTGAVVLTASDVGALPSSTVIPAAQIQSDWTQADDTKADFIKNKPTIPAAQVQSDWTEADDTKVDFIKNKPTIPTVNNSTITIQKNGTTVDSFTTNASSGKTINITVPTTASDVSALPSNTTYVSTVNGSSGAVTVQATLVGSGTGQNIKSINGSSILGSGDISLQTPLTAGTDYQTPLTIDSSLSTSSTNPVQNKAIGLLTTTGGSLGGVTTSTEGNQIALKGFVNSSINALAAYYITKNATGDPFATHAELAASTTVYSGGSVRVPTRNDYCVVLADETNGSGDSTRYTYNSDSSTYSATNWAYQYTYNKQFTQAQIDALDSGITSSLVTKLNGIASGAEVNVQSDWSQTTSTADDYIKNKPTKLSQFSNDSGFTTNTGTVTSVSGGTGLTGTVTTTGSISLATSGVTAGSYGPSADSSPSHGGTFSVPYITVDTYGRETAASTKTITLPSETSLSKGTDTGGGNCVTDISVSGHTITLTKGITALTSETSLSKGTTSGSGNAVTDLSVSGHTITLTKGTTFADLSSSQALTNKTYNGYTLGAACAASTTTSVTSGGTDLVTSGGVYSWGQAKHSVTTVTLATTVWNSSTLTSSAISVTGVTASNTVVVSPAPSSFEDYGAAGIYCSAQAAGTLTFKCTTVPTSSISVNVLILN